MDNTISIEDAIAMVINRLDSLRIPTSLTSDVALPICQSVDLLQTCLNAMKAAKENKVETEVEETKTDSESAQ